MLTAICRYDSSLVAHSIINESPTLWLSTELVPSSDSALTAFV